MSLIVLWHGEDRYHCDTSLFAVLSACALVNRREVGVHISGISASAGNFLSCSRNFTQSVRVVGDIGKNYQNVHSLFKSEILGSSKSHFRSRKPLDSRIVCEVYEKNRSVKRTRALEALDEVFRFLECDTHCRENNGELLVLTANLSLTRDLSRKLCVRKSAR